MVFIFAPRWDLGLRLDQLEVTEWKLYHHRHVGGELQLGGVCHYHISLIIAGRIS